MIRLDLYQSPVSAYLILLKCRGRRGLLSMQIKILMIKIRRLESEHRFALFDGKSVFKFGTDDALRNMHWRLDKVSKINVSGGILLEVFSRLQEHDTAYKCA